MSSQWNPPPPTRTTFAEEDFEHESDDGIGESLFSKSWVLSVLVRAVESVCSVGQQVERGGEDEGKKETERGEEGREMDDKAKENERDRMGEEKGLVNREEHREDGEEKKGNSTKESVEREMESDNEGAKKGEERDVKEERERCGKIERRGEEEENNEELDKNLEDDLCQLWDASMNSVKSYMNTNRDVALFLNQQNAVDLLMGVLSRSNSLRLTEICVGLLGNMACQEAICRDGFLKQIIVKTVLSLLCNADTRILYETTRLITTCLSLSTLGECCWLNEIRDDQTVRDSLLFIMTSSTNDELLCSTGALVDTLLDIDEVLLKRWTDDHLVHSLCQAIKQTMSSSSLDGAGSFIQCLHAISTTECGVACLVKLGDEVSSVVLSFLTSLSSGEGYIEKNTMTLHAALSLLHSLINNHHSSSSSSSSSSASSAVFSIISATHIQEMLQNIVLDIETEQKSLENDQSDCYQQLLKLLSELLLCRMTP